MHILTARMRLCRDTLYFPCGMFAIRKSRSRAFDTVYKLSLTHTEPSLILVICASFFFQGPALKVYPTMTRGKHNATFWYWVHYCLFSRH